MGAHLYGGARQVAYLLDGLAAHPGEHALVCAAGAALADAIHNPAVRIHPLHCGGDADLSFIPRLRRVIRAEQPDLLHLHSRRADLLTALAGHWENLAMLHSRRVDNPPRWLDCRLKFPLFRRIITISDGIRQVLLSAGVPPQQIVCIPSAVDTTRYTPLPPPARARARAELLEPLGLNPDAPVLALIAQLIPRKGHQLFLDALPQILQRHPNAQTLIFGRGPLTAELHATIAARGLDAHVHLQGFRPDMHSVIPLLDLVVHPALMEGLGVALLEAAACGVAIVASRVGGIPEIVHDGVNGRLVEAGATDALAQAINTLLDNPDQLKTYGAAGRQLVLEQFSIARMVADNQQVYVEQLAAKTQPSHRR